MKISTFVIVTTMLVGSFSIASAQEPPGGEVAYILKTAGEGNKPFQMLIVGSLRAYETINFLAKKNGGPKGFCPPDQLELTTDQTIAIMEKFLNKNPDLKSTAVGGLSYIQLMALRETFPCG